MEERMLKLFAYGHLEREDLLAVSKPFAELAERVVGPMGRHDDDGIVLEELQPAPQQQVAARERIEDRMGSGGG
jgi:hypothetical protein